MTPCEQCRYKLVHETPIVIPALFVLITGKWTQLRCAKQIKDGAKPDLIDGRYRYSDYLTCRKTRKKVHGGAENCPDFKEGCGGDRG